MLSWLVAAIICTCGIGGPVQGPYEPAERMLEFVQVREVPPPPDVAPPFTSDNDGRSCTGAIGLLIYYSPGWDVARMARIMYRESKCQPWADNPSSSAEGLLQILMGTHCVWIRVEFGSCTIAMLRDPVMNIQVAASLWRKQGHSAWNL